MSNENWQIGVDPGVQKALKRFPHHDAEVIAAEIDIMSIDPYTGDTLKMKGETNVWRRRVGAYRIRYKIYPERRVIFVYHVERRTSTTYR